MSVIVSLLILLLEAFLVVILIRVVFSWVSPVPTNPVSRLAWMLTEPILAPIRRVLPATAGLDLSPMVVWLLVIVLIGLLRNFA